MSQSPLNLFLHHPRLAHGAEPPLGEIIEAYYLKHGLAADRAAEVAKQYMVQLSADVVESLQTSPRDDYGHQCAQLNAGIKRLMKTPSQMIPGDVTHIAAVKLYNAIESGDRDKVFEVIREIKAAFPLVL